MWSSEVDSVIIWSFAWLCCTPSSKTYQAYATETYKCMYDKLWNSASRIRLRLAYDHIIFYMCLRPPTPPREMPTSTMINVNLLINLYVYKKISAQLGEARKLGNRNERRREGKRWATLPPTVSDTVGFGYLSNVFFCGLLAPPRETCPGRRPQAPACFKSGDAQGTPGILDRMACGVALALAIGGVSCAADPPRGKKAALFWGVLDVHKTSQIPSKMALGRGRFGARGGSPKKQNTRGKLVFKWFVDNFWCCIFCAKI